ncbi:MAG TPA: hypothetical protein VG273_18000 [Bryobacteraceae bacterium]|jgi:mannose-6-phosphate isomerase-like protein (cupin superfamily)|nr:hypothetical protein [Bryobacteraceae bacterium]
MRRVLVLISASLFAQTPADHMRVPPPQEPSVYLSEADAKGGLDKIDPKQVATPTGASVSLGKGLNAVVRRRVTGPQYAIVHMKELEYVVVTKGHGTMVTGGALIPPTIDSDVYPGTAIVRSAVGVKGGLARKIGPGDVIVTPPGTPHWLSEIDGAIEYVEIRIPK